MKALLRVSFIPFVLLVLLSPLVAQNEVARRDYATPGLALNAGGRTGACDALRFTADGSQLLAVGDDKLLRTWNVDADALRLADQRDLRWASWQEKRGHIFALALSPDKEQRWAALAGDGMNAGAVAVLDRRDGSIAHGILGKPEFNTRKVWSMGIAPDSKSIAFGTDDGHVCVWQLEPKAPLPRKLTGRHDMAGPDGKALYSNRVRLLEYLSATELLSVSENGQVLVWDLKAADKPPRELFRFDARFLLQAALSPDRQWLAGAHDRSRQVELRKLSDKSAKVFLEAKPNRYARSLSFDAASRTLAVGYWEMDGKPETDFPREIDFSVWLFDLTAAKPGAALAGRLLGKLDYFPEALAFHPTRPVLAVAGGENHEIALWNHATGKQGQPVVSAGRCLWGVGLSGDNRYLAFQDRRAPQPKGINQRGAGLWKIFDLHQLRWADARDPAFKPAADGGESGWQVYTRHPSWTPKDDANGTELRSQVDRWWIKEKTGNAVTLLPWDPAQGQPRCYVLLKATKLRKYARLVVGHAFGVSVYDLVPGKGAVRTRLLSGHEGEVMALAVSQDQKRLVTCGRDQTIAGWSLEDWPSHPTFGARVVVIGGEPVVNAVDPGSPAWEMGLTAGDVLVYISVEMKVVFDSKQKKALSTEALAALQNPVPGQLLWLKWKRPGQKDELEQITTLPQRPLFRFFPAGQEWVLWRWRDHAYACSTQGDSLIGWQLNHWEKVDMGTATDRDLMLTPDFFRAEQMRQVYHRPDAVAKMLQDWVVRPEAVKLAEIAPPTCSVEPVGAAIVNGKVFVKKDDLKVKLTASPGRDAPQPAKGETATQTLTRAILWVNDYMADEWDPRKEAFPKTVTIPRAQLRRGHNEIRLQCYNHGGARGESAALTVFHDAPEVPLTVRGLFVGVGNYTRSSPRQEPLRANYDAKDLVRLWAKQKGKLYQEARLTTLLDDDVSPRAVMDALEAVGRDRDIRPDDLFVFNLGGHGTTPAALKAAFPKLADEDLKGLSPYLFCCGDFDVKRLHDTTINFADLYRALVKIPCRKLILLDTCHAGGIGQEKTGIPINPIRELTPDAMGPIILMACEPHQSALGHPALDDHLRFTGLFLIALAMTMEEEFAAADADKRGALRPGQVAASIKRLMPTLVERWREVSNLGRSFEQTPVAFVPAPEDYWPVVGK
jgi:WD40 repeat protein